MRAPLCQAALGRWVMPGAVLDLWFARGLYWFNGGPIKLTDVMTLNSASVIENSGLSITGTNLPQISDATAAAAVRAAKSFFFEATMTGAQNVNRLLEIGTSGSSSFICMSAATTLATQDTGGHQANATFGIGTDAVRSRYAVGLDAARFWGRANGGRTAVSANPWTGTSGTVYVGNRSSGDRPLAGIMHRMTVGNSQSSGVFDGRTGI